MEYDEDALQEVRETRLLIDKCDAWLFDLIQPHLGMRVLDIGCGLGNLLKLLRDREFAYGIDVSESSVEYVNRKFEKNPNIGAETMDVSSPEFLHLKSHKFDTAVSLNVFEHIEDDVVALQHVYEVLEPSGRLVLIIPAHQTLYGSMDSSIGHYRRYTTDSLGHKLHAVGLNVKSQRYVNPIGALGWFVNGRILGRGTPPTAQLSTFNRIMPLVTLVDKYLSFPFGLSVVSVSEKPGM